MAVFDDNQPFTESSSKHGLDGLCHRGCSLSRSQHDDTLEPSKVVAPFSNAQDSPFSTETPVNGFDRIDRVEAGAEQSGEQSAGSRIGDGDVHAGRSGHGPPMMSQTRLQWYRRGSRPFEGSILAEHFVAGRDTLSTIRALEDEERSGRTILRPVVLLETVVGAFSLGNFQLVGPSREVGTPQLGVEHLELQKIRAVPLSDPLLGPATTL